MRGSGGIEILVIPGGQKSVRGAAPPPPPQAQSRWPYVYAGSVVLLCTLVCWAMFGRFDKSNLIMVYLLGVAFVATRFDPRADLVHVGPRQ